ncbi:MAG: GNAT family N-acetyltransferase [Acidobacteria bacterium]|nr:GNAT family N-acetyltransferase [Acidobacteriota bacterium]
MDIKLRKVDEHNWRAVIALGVHVHQAEYVASNLFSLAESYVKPGRCEHYPLAIYDRDNLTGFALYACDEDNASIQWVKRFMIDKKYQGRGFGKPALLKLIALIRESERCEEIKLTVTPENAVARKLYESVGFFNTEDMHEGELIFSLRLDNHLRLAST